MQVTIFVECHENNSRIQYPYSSPFYQLRSIGFFFNFCLVYR